MFTLGISCLTTYNLPRFMDLTFQVPKLVKIFCAPCKGRVSVSHSPLALLKVSLTDLQSQAFWGLIFLVQGPQSGKTYVGVDHLFLEENFNCCYTPIIRLPTSEYGLTMSPPP